MRLTNPSGRRRRSRPWSGPGLRAGSSGAIGPGPGPGPEPPRRGRAERRRLARRVRRRRARRVPRRAAAVLCGGILLTLLLKTFVAQAFVIPSASMDPTLRVGDRILVERFSRWFGSGPARGDVAVFTDPGGWIQHPSGPGSGQFPGEGVLAALGLVPSGDGRTLVKRVVAVGGDTVEGDADGRVRVDGMPVDPPPGTPTGPVRAAAPFRVTVPAGRLFVLGDNRGNSADSRAHLDNGYGGSIPDSSVVGKAVAVVWPGEHWRSL
ncbi:signal peptidase I [Streptomyces sp. IBSNAI002]|uniref:signal peptidase I n=1 Tax=Streptomyces sp. IBSNAI002 TaxID=3457500 RepID=UPI003FD270BC